jgi:CRP/FNR family transcriptional regulator, cyclic AMP receptor protein
MRAAKRALARPGEATKQHSRPEGMFSVADLSMFANDLDAQAYPAGHRFFSAGDHGEIMYVVTEGEIEIVLRGKVLETVIAGGIFGELALIDHRDRSADVTAKTDVKISAIDQKRFLYLVRNHPFFALEVMKIMADRLRKFDDLL